MSLGRRTWSPNTLKCCDCGATLKVERTEKKVAVDAAFAPGIPGAICHQCFMHIDGLKVPDVETKDAVHLIQGQDYEIKTVDAIQAWLDFFGWNAPVAGACASRLHAENKSREAYDLLKAAREHTDPGFIDNERAMLLLIDGETGQALDLLTSTTAADHPRWHLHNGILANSVGKIEAAAEHFKLQIKDHPNEILGWSALGFHYMQEMGDYPAAESTYRQACELFPTKQEFRAWLGDALLRMDRHREALTELESSLFLEPLDERFSAGVEDLIVQIRETLGESE